MLEISKTRPETNIARNIGSLDDIRSLLKSLPMASEGSVIEARKRDLELTKPRGSLGRLEEIVFWLCRWQQKSVPDMDHPQVCVFAGNHGITRHDISAFPASVTALMVENFVKGGAAINQLSKELGAEITIRALDLDHPTCDFTQEAAMSEDECVDAFRTGMEAVNPNASLMCPGEMGIGNTTSAAAICHLSWNGMPSDWVGSGTGINNEQYQRKIDVVRQAKFLHDASVTDGLDVLRCVGGREIVAMAGAIIAARLLHVPVMLDGFICGAAAAALYETSPQSLLHCMVGHGSAEPGHSLLLDRIGKRPLLDLGLRLGEGTGAVLAGLVVRAAVTCHNNMACFDDIGLAQGSAH
jgi:nicotinate-nucleotide--dimethylbenzimidazole phosphoribosyltransferase